MQDERGEENTGHDGEVDPVADEQVSRVESAKRQREEVEHDHEQVAEDQEDPQSPS